jgi:hypothetical protein
MQPSPATMHAAQRCAEELGNAMQPSPAPPNRATVMA